MLGGALLRVVLVLVVVALDGVGFFRGRAGPVDVERIYNGLF